MRSDPNRNDWLSNIWAYAQSIEKRVFSIEDRLAKLEAQAKVADQPLKMKVEVLPLDDD